MPASHRCIAASLHRGVDAARAQRLLNTAATGTAGHRDTAILALQVGLRLRAHEVAALRLDDIGWRGGELTAHGEGSHAERLPLPADVGETLVDYLRHERPGSAERAMFRAFAPPGPVSPGCRSSAATGCDTPPPYNALSTAARSTPTSDHWVHSHAP